MDTISISALVSLPEPTQAQPNIIPLAQSVNSLSFGAVLAASTKSTRESEATINVDAPAIGGPPHVNKLTVPPNIIVEAVVAAINVAISQAALKSATEELAAHTASPQGDDNVWVQDSGENHEHDYKLQGLSEAAAIIVTADHDAPMLNATVQTSNEHTPNIVIDTIAKTIDREPIFTDLSNHQNLASSLTNGSDADHASPKLHYEKHTISSGAVQEPLRDLAPDIGSDHHGSGTETQEETKSIVPNASPEVATLRDHEQEAEKIVAVSERNIMIATNTNNENTHTDKSAPEIASSLTPKTNAPRMFEIKPTDATTQSVLSDTRPSKTSLASNNNKVVMSTGSEIMAIRKDYTPNQPVLTTAEPQIIRIVDAIIKKHSSDETVDAAASFKTSGADTDHNQNAGILKTPKSNLNVLSDQVPNLKLNEDHTLTSKDDAKRPTERQIVESKSLDQPLSKLIVPDAFPEVATLREPEQEPEKIVAVPERNIVIATNTNNENTHTDKSTPALAPSLTPKTNAPRIFDIKSTDATTPSVLSDTRPQKTSLTSNNDKVVMSTGSEIMAIRNDYSSNQHVPVPNITLHGDQKLTLRNEAKRPTERQIVESKNLDQPLSSNVIPTTGSDLMIRANLEKVAAVTESLIKISQERHATTPDPVTILKISDANIPQTIRSFATDVSFSQEIVGPSSDSLIASKKLSRDIAPAASTLTYVPDFSLKTTDTNTVRLPPSTELIDSATAYIAPTKSEQVAARQLNDANAKTSAASTVDTTAEADEGLNKPDEKLTRATSNGGKPIIDAAPRPQTPAQTIITDNPGLLRTDQTPAKQTTNPPASPAPPPESHDSRPRHISEDIRLRALERQVVIAAREGANQIRMQLYPPGMGQVLIRLALDGSKLRLQFKTSSSEATSSLHDVEDALRHALGDSGFTITSFDVSDEESEARDERRRDRNVVTPAARQQETSPFSFELQA